MRQKALAKKALAVFLSVALVWTMSPSAALTAAAAQTGGGATSQETPSDSDAPTGRAANEDLSKLDLKINGHSAAKGQNLVVTYGQNLEFSIGEVGRDYPGQVKFYYRDASAGEDDDYTPIVNGACTLELGSYELRYEYTDSSHSVHTCDAGLFKVTVQQGVAQAPGNLRWNGSSPEWDAVATTTDGGTLAGSISYKVAAYKDGDPISEDLAATIYTTLTNFHNYISKDGAGTYTFTVQTLVNDASGHFAGSAVSSVSGAFVVPEIVVSPGTGIKDASPDGPFMLIPGDSVQADVSAVVRDGYSFAGWTASSSSVEFADASALATKVKIKNDGNVTSTITITPMATDGVAPTVTDPVKGADGQLTATASDDQEGVKKYAFSTASSAEGVADSEWVEVEEPAAGLKTFTHNLSAGGKYYFYASDGNHITQSLNAIPVTSVTYKNYYENDQVAAKVDYLIGEGDSVSLAIPERTAWNFDGWYEDADLTVAAQDPISEHRDGGYSLFAKWIEVQLPELSVANYEKQYDGVSHNLEISGLEDFPYKENLTYQWYRGGQIVEGESATGATYAVRNVADTAVYSVVVTLVDAAGQKVSQKTVENINVGITPAPLTLKAEDKTIIVHAELPELTVSYRTLLGDDAQNPADAVSFDIGCSSYSPDTSDADEYDIVLSNITSANYTVTSEDGTLTVSPMEGEMTVELAVDPSTIVYNGEEQEPAVTVKFGDIELGPENYSVSYTNNVNAGDEAVATVNLKGNYKGTKSIPFTINRAYFHTTVIPVNWKYDSLSHESEFSLAGYPQSANDVNVTYYYKKKGSEAEYVAVAPVDAGTYEVYAVIDETENYTKSTTDSGEFTVSQRHITLKANSKTFNYDGSAHSDSGYTVAGEDEFVSGQGFYTVTVTGSQLDVTPEDMTPNNIITYELNSITAEDNYVITTEDGYLRVNAVVLPVPFNASWNKNNVGTASWVAVSKANLQVSYNLRLFAVADGEEPSVVLVDGQETVQTDSSSYDFADAIRGHAAAAAAENKAYEYYYQIQAVPSGGSAQGNFIQSEWSEPTSSIQTVQLKALGESQGSVASVSVGGSSSGTCILINGESVSVHAVATDGYSFAEENQYTSTSGVTVAVDSCTATDLYAIVTANTDASSINEEVVFSAIDDAPIIDEYAYAYGEGYKSVGLSLKANDTVGIVGYAIKKGQEEPVEWTGVAPTTSIDVSQTIVEAGEYYAFVKDSSGNVTCCEQPIVVYELSFNKGDQTATGEMDSLLKVKGSTIDLPKNLFQRDGYVFQNWHAASGTYGDEGHYSANASEELVAAWTMNQYAYKVNYYNMDVNGEYPSTPTMDRTFSAGYESVIDYDKHSLQLEQDGFQLDQSKYGEDEGQEPKVTVITGPNQEINLYYQRNSYNLTKTYTLPGEATPTIVTVPVLFGTDLIGTSEAPGLLNDAGKPTSDGYVFVGWLFGDNGALPATMPSNAVAATGRFEPNKVEYKIEYYQQDLNEDGTAASTYSKIDSLTRDMKGVHGEAVSINANSAPQIEGFTYVGATDDENVAPVEAFTGAAANGKIIKVYYDRNSYAVNLNIWQGAIGGAKVYTAKAMDLLYGAALPADLTTITEYNSEEWPAIPNGYCLSNTVGWSTGSAPETMPAGDVAVNRQYVLEVEGRFNVEVRIETAVEGIYETKTFTFYNNVGNTVSIGNAETDTIKLDSLKNGINYFQYYEEKAKADPLYPTIYTGRVTDTNANEAPLTLRIYLDRKVVTSTITYVVDGTNVATVNKSAKWGHKYSYEPLALFDPSEGGNWSTELHSGFTMSKKVEDLNPDAYDFRNNNYVVSYIGTYNLNDDTHWHVKDFDTEAKLTDDDDGYTMGYSNNHVSVYYTKANPESMFRVRTYYRPFDTSGNADVPLTYTYDNVKYESVYVASEAYFYKNATFQSAGAHSDYPGLNYLVKSSAAEGHYVYDVNGELKDGFRKVAIDGVAYYINDAENAFYIADKNNRLYINHLTSYGMTTNGGNNQPGTQDAVDYLNAYKAVAPTDPYRQGARFYNKSYGQTIKYNTADGAKLVLTFVKGDVYQVSYNLGGAICSNDQHEIAAGATLEKPGCNHSIMVQRPGYRIVWYTSEDFATQANQPVAINRNTTFYGRYEKEIVKNKAYAYYQLPQDVTRGDASYTYITKDDIDAFQDDEKFAFTSTTETVTVRDEFGKDVQVELTTTTYTYDGDVAMVAKEIPSLTFSTQSFNPASLPVVAGTRYEASNPNNVVSSYVEDAATAFSAYFVRDKYYATVDVATPKVSAAVNEYRAGQTVTVSQPQREGYDFAGWTWKKTADGSTCSVDFAINQDGSITFKMPEYDVKLVATWTAAKFQTEITHFFQNTDLLFAKDTVDAMKTDVDQAETVTVAYKRGNYEGLLYPNGNISFVNDENEVAYVIGAFEQDGVYVVALENIVAITQKIEVTQDASSAISDSAVSMNHYNFASAVHEYDGVVSTLSFGDSFINSAGMTLEYYYNLETFSLDAEGKLVPANAKGDITVLGEGDYPYGKTVNLKVSLSDGFELVGWFKAEDVPEGDGLPAVAPLSSEASYPVLVTGEASYVAVAKATDPAQPTIVLTGDSSLEYKYKTGEGSVTAKVSMPEDADDANYVKGYQWKKLNPQTGEFEDISGAVGATYMIPSGWEAGSYQLMCVVTTARKDNNVEVVTESDPFTVEVVKRDLMDYVTSANHSSVFDNRDNHRIALSLSNEVEAKDYSVYYSQVELTAENIQGFIEDGTAAQVNPGFRDVNWSEDAKSSVPYTVYWYVMSNSQNYKDCAGSNTVTITPKRVILTPQSQPYSKVYDGAIEVQGDILDSNTDLGRLARGNGVFNIEGLAEGETGDTYIVKADAVFNSKHVADATAVTMSNLELANSVNGNVTHNYAFDSTFNISLPASIERKQVALSWSGNSFQYSGAQQGPEAVLPEGAVPSVDEGKLTVSVTGKQVNCGAFSASAELVSSDEDTKTDDFTVTNSNQGYTIVQREITVAMISNADDPYIYDKKAHGLTQGEVVEGSLVENQSITVVSTETAVDAGSFNVTPTSWKITDDASGADLTSNYNVSTSNSGVLSIAPKPISVASGVSAQSKPYDGTTEATLDVTAAVLTGVVESDDVHLSEDSVSGEFTDPAVGEGKQVSLTYVDLDNALVGDRASNYVLDVTSSQDTTNADITAVTLTLIAHDATVVYGENASFGYEYSGFVDNEGLDVITGTPSFKIRDASDASGKLSEYSTSTPAGTYAIVPDASGLSATNYVFEIQEATLTVAKRQVTVAKSENADVIEKVYDATTNVPSGKPAAGSHYEFAKVDGEGTTGPVNNDNLTLTFDAAYDQATVGNRTVTMSNLALDADSAKNYDLVAPNPDLTFDGLITQKELLVKADEQTITYGNAAPAYTVSYSGFEGSDNETVPGVLGGTLAFDCAYNVEDPAQRGVGTYPITPSGLDSANYDVKFEGNNLEVLRKELEVTAKAIPTTIVYGSSPIPAFSYEIAGFEYGETEEVVTGLNEMAYAHSLKSSDNGSGSMVVSSVPGTYYVWPNVDTLSAGNYKFSSKKCDVIVSKKSLTIRNLVVNPRVYDGTVVVRDGQIDRSNVEYDGILGFDSAYLSSHPEEVAFTVNDAVYSDNDKNVGENKPVSFTIAYGKYLDDRYERNYDQSSAVSAITPRPLNIVADSKRIPYGTDFDDYTVRFERIEGNSDSGFAEGESAGKNDVTIVSDYSNEPNSRTPVGEYLGAIKVSNLRNTATLTAANYDITYTHGDLEVFWHQLKTPPTTWIDDQPGVVTWDAVPGIGDVAVASYTAQLQIVKPDKSRENVGEAVIGINPEQGKNSMTCSFAEAIRENGAGEYKVAVTAVASEVNNEGKANVQDSDSGTENDESLFAANVKFVFSGDDDTQAGKGENITINGEDGNAGYVVIAGEDYPIAATLKNATGYTIGSVASSANDVTVADGTDTAREGASYASTVSMAADHGSSSEVTVTLTLAARPATLRVTVDVAEGSRRETDYGYGLDTAPTFTAIVTTDEGDVYDEYAYTYAWEYKVGTLGASTPLPSVEGLPETAVVPLGLLAVESPTDYYRIRCIVTAVRSDNGKSCQVDTENSKSTWTTSLGYVTNFIIHKAVFSAEAQLAGWKYGETPNSPSVANLSPNDDETRSIEPAYSYRVKGDGDNAWTATKPTDAGDYQVKAFFDFRDDANYKDFNTDPVDFTIQKAKLDTPQGLAMDVSDTASYGTISWGAVSGPRANGDGKQVDVSYEVKLYNGDALVETYTTSDTSLDVTDKLQAGGTYTFTVQAISHDDVNCDNSDLATSAAIPVGATIAVTNGGTQSGSSWTRKYDGSATRLEAQFTGSGTISGYQWYKNGAAIERANSANYEVTHVVESDNNYTCVLTVDGVEVYTPIVHVTVTTRDVVLTSKDDEKVYDGTSLVRNTQADVNIGGSGFANGEGAKFNISGFITDVGQVDNAFTYILDANTTSTDYDIECSVGKLTVKPRSLSENETYISVADITEHFVYNGQEHKPTPGVTDGGLETGHDAARESLGSNDISYSYGNNIAAGDGNTATVTMTGNRAAGVYDAGTGNYCDSIQRTFHIEPQSLKQGEADYLDAHWDIPQNVTYDSNPHKPIPTVTSVHPNVVLEENVDYTVAYRYRYDENSSWTDIDNPADSSQFVQAGQYEVAITGKGNYKGTDTKVFTIACKAVTVTAEDKSKTYGDNDPPLTAKISGLVSGESESLISYSVARVPHTEGATEPEQDAGTYQNVLVASGNTIQGNYTVSYVPGMFTINQRNLADSNVIAVGAISSKVYDGDAYKPALSITHQKAYETTPATLVVGNDKDYTVVYSNNTNATTDSSKAAATITGVGNYTGEITRDYDITKRNVTVTANVGQGKVYGTDESSHMPYTWTAADDNNGDNQILTWVPTAGTRDQTNRKYDGLNVSLSRVDNENVGSYQLSAQYGNNPNYNITYIPADFAITPKTLTDQETIHVEMTPEVVYDAQSHQPEPVVTYDRTNGQGIETLVKGKDYELTFKRGNDETTDFTSEGVITVIITAKDGGNFKDSITKTFTINKRQVTVSPDANQKKIYGYDDPQLTWSVQNADGSPLADNLRSLLNVKISREVGEDVKYDNGNIVGYAITVEGGTVPEGQTQANRNFNITYKTSAETGNYFTINKRDLTITSDGDTKIYDGTPLTRNGPTNIRVEGLAKNQSLNIDDTLGTKATGTITNAGVAPNTVDLTWAGAGNTFTAKESNYNVTNTPGTLKIEKRKVTVTADVKTMIYGEAVPGLTWKAVADNSDEANLAWTDTTGERPSGAAWDNLNVSINSDQNGNVKYKQDGTVDSYAITVSDGSIPEGKTEANPNYDITYENSAFTINPKNLGVDATYAEKISVEYIQPEKYDGTDHTPVPVVTYQKYNQTAVSSTLLVNDVDFELSYADNRDAGVNTETATVYVTGKGNYAGTIIKMFEIKQRHLTVKSADGEKQYDGTPLTKNDPTKDIEITGDGFVEGEGRTFTITGSQTAVGNSPNYYDSTPWEGTKGGNYAITYLRGTLTVKDREAEAKYDVTVNSVSTTALYDGEEHEAKGFESVTYNNEKQDCANPNTVTVAIGDVVFEITGLTTGNPKQTNWRDGGYPNTIDGNPVVTDPAGNVVTNQFNVHKNDGSLVINKRELTMTSADDEKPYDGAALTNSTVTVTGDGFATGEGATYFVTGSQTIVGKSSNTFTYNLNEGTLADNYIIRTSEGTLEVKDRANKPKLAVKAKSGTFPYDKTTHYVSGFVNEADYTLGNATYKAIKVYDGAIPYYVTGLTSSWEGTDVADSADDAHPIAVEGTAIILDANGNDVTDQFQPTMVIHGTAIISPATATVTVKDVSKYYGKADPAFAADVRGINGEDISRLIKFDYTREAGEIVKYDNGNIVGYAITAIGDPVQGNYAITYTPGVLTINPEPLSDSSFITAVAPDDVTFKGAVWELDPKYVTYVTDGSTELGTQTLSKGTDFDLSYADNLNVGTATITISGKGNYAGSTTVSFQIDQAPVTVKAVSNSKTYGQFDPEFGAEVEGVVEGDSFEVEYEVARPKVGVEEDADTYAKAIEVSGKPVQGNYRVTFEPADFTINPKPLDTGDGVTTADKITFADLAELTYTGLAQIPTLSVSYNAPLGNRSLNATTDFTVEGDNNTDASAAATVTISGVGNYSGSLTRTFTINPAEYWIKTEGATKVYDGQTLTNAVATVEGLKNGEKATVSGTGATGPEVSSVKNNYGNVTWTTAKESNYWHNEDRDNCGTLKITEQSVDPKKTAEEGYLGVQLTLSEDKIYNAEDQKPAVAVTGEKPAGNLVEGRDYTVAFTRNGKPTTDFTNVGEIVVTITGMGNYMDTQSKTYTISQAEGWVENKDYPESFTYTANQVVAPTMGNFTTNSDAESFSFLWRDKDNHIMSSRPVGVGNYTLEVKVPWTPNVSACSTTVPVTISYYETDAEAYATGEKKVEGSVWFTSDVTINAPEGFELYRPSTTRITQDGTHTVTYQLKEKSTGFITAPKTLEVKRDATAPAIRASVVEADVVAQLLGWTIGKDQLVVKAEVKDGTAVEGTHFSGLNGVTFQLDGAEPQAATAAEDGNFYFTIKANYKGGIEIKADDKAGNVATATIQKLNADASLPTINVTTKVADQWYNASNVPALEVSASDNNAPATESGISIVTYQKGDDAAVDLFRFNSAFASDFVHEWDNVGSGVNPAEGNYTYTFVVTDNAGNFATASQAVKLDKTAPVVDTAAVDNITDHTATINASASDKAPLGVNQASGVAECILMKNGVVVDRNATGQFLLSDLERNMAYTYTVVAVDNAGNYSEAYEVSFTTLKTEIVALALDTYSVVYDGAEKEPATTVEADGNVLVKDKDYTVVYAENVNVGTATVTVTGIGNYSGTLSKTFEITKRKVTVQADSKSMAYGDQERPGLTWFATDGDNGDGKTLTWTSTTGAAGQGQADLNVSITREEPDNYNVKRGEEGQVLGYVITVSDGQGDDPNHNYDITYATGATYTVNPVAVKVAADSKTKVYGDADPELTAVVTGLVNEEPETLISFKLSRQPGEDVARYAIFATGEAVQGNYDVSFSGADFQITKRKVTVQADSKSMDYGAQERPGLTWFATDGDNGDGKTLTWEPSTGAAQGDYADLNVSITREEPDNYNVKRGEEGQVLGYAITVSDGQVPEGKTEANPNYDITYATGATYTVNPVAVKVAADDKTKIYGDPDPELTAVVTGLVNDESEDLISFKLSRQPGEDVGRYAISATGEAVQGNYDVSFSGADFQITKRPVTVTVGTGQHKTYADFEPEVLVWTATDGVQDGKLAWEESTGVAQGDYDSLKVSLSRQPGEDVGTYAITSQESLDADNPNYDITFEGADFAINAKSLTDEIAISVAPIDPLVYNGLEQTPDVTVTFTRPDGSPQQLGEDDVVITYEDNKNVGTATVTITAVEGGNFVDSRQVTFRIVPAPVTVRVDDKEKIYGDADPELTAVITGLVNDEPESLISFELSREEGEEHGAYVILATGEEAQGNYSVTYEPGLLVIDYKVVRVIADADQGKIYGQLDAPLTATIEGLLDADKAENGQIADLQDSKPMLRALPSQAEPFVIQYDIARAQGEDVGEYDIVVTGEPFQGSYAVEYVGNVYTISPKSLGKDNVYADGIAVKDITDELVFNGSAFTPVPVITYTKPDGTVQTLVAGVDFEVEYLNNVEAGTATIKITGIGNFMDSITKTFVIQPAPVQPDSSDSNKTAKTGDQMPLTAAVVAMVLSGATLFGVRRRKEEEEQKEKR